MQSKKDIKKYLPIDIQERITAHEMKILIPFYFSEWKKNMDKCYKIELVESNMHVKWCGIKYTFQKVFKTIIFFLHTFLSKKKKV